MGATDRSGCLQSLFEAAASFGLSASEAARVWDEIRVAVSAWRGVATANGIGAGEQRRFADALDARIEA